MTAVTSCDISRPQFTVEDLVICPGDLYFNQLAQLSVGKIELCSFTCWVLERFVILATLTRDIQCVSLFEDAPVSHQMYNILIQNCFEITTVVSRK